MLSVPKKRTKPGNIAPFNIERVIFTGIHENYRNIFEKAGIIDLVKDENIYSTIDNAVEIMHRSRSFSDK
jgi:hypothetical protein